MTSHSPHNQSPKEVHKSHQRLTLQQYLQAHRIRKRLQQRNRSRSRGRVQGTGWEEDRMDGIFGAMDKMLIESKMDIQEQISKGLNPEKLFILMSTLLDKFLLHVKQEMRKMYREMLTQYTVEAQMAGKPGADGKVMDGGSEEYFRSRLEEAEENVRRGHLTQTVKDQFKQDSKNKQLFEVIVKTSVGMGSGDGIGRKKEKEFNFMEAILGASKGQGIAPKKSEQKNAIEGQLEGNIQQIQDKECVQRIAFQGEKTAKFSPSRKQISVSRKKSASKDRS